MSDQNKTRQQLIDEIVELRQKVAGLEVLEAEGKRAEEELRRREASYRELADSIADVFFAFDKDLRYTYWNKASEELTGIPARDAIGKFLYELFPDTTEIRTAEGVYLDVLRTQQPQSFGSEYQHGGKNYFFEISVYPCMSGLSVFVKDTTERKRIEEILEKEQQELKLIIDSSPIIVFYKDKEGKFIRVNKAFSEALKIHEEEFVGKTVFDLYSAKIAQGMTDDDQEVLKSGSPKLNIIEQYESASGIRWVQTDKIPICDKNCIPVGLIGFAQDISGRKRAEEALQKAEEKYRGIFENAVEGILQANTQGRFLSVNPAFASMYGYESPEELINTVTDIGHQVYVDPNDRLQLLRLMQEKGVVRNFQTQVYRKDGSVMWISMNGRGIYDSVGRFLYYEGIVQDITERKRAEEALREGKEFTENLIASMQDGFSVLDSDGVHIDVNSAFCQMTGFSREELIGVGPPHPYWPSEAYEEIERAFQRTLRGEFSDFELTFMRKNGERFPVIVSPSLIKDKQDNVISYFATVKDITERKQAEKALQESEARFRSYFELPLIGLAITSPEKEWIEVNDRICSILGYSRDEIVQRTWLELTHPDDLAADIEQFNLILSGQIEKYSMEKRFIRKDGQVVWTSISVGCVRKPDGRVDYIIGLMEDITERRRIEEAFKKSEVLHKEAQKTAHIGHWELDTSIMVPTWSEEIFRILGLDPQKDPPSFAAHQKVTHPDDWNILNNAVTRSINEGIPFDIDFRILRPDKTIHWMHAIGHPKKDSEGRIVSLFGTAQDVTESKQSEDQLRNSHEQLRALSTHLQSIREEERTLMAREIHDELGQELTGLKMDLTWLVRRLSKNQKSLISKTESMLKLVDNTIQTVRRISSKLRPGVLDDLGLIAAIEWQVQDFENRTGITCVFSSSLEEIGLDRDRSTAVFRIFQEALTNVSRHANATRVKINLEADADTLILRIEDNGKGIKESEVSHPKSLGLLGMRERVFVFGGKVEISGIPKKGTSVVLKIPLER